MEILVIKYVANKKMGFYVNYKRFYTRKNLMKLIREKKDREIILCNGKRKWKKCYIFFLWKIVSKSYCWKIKHDFQPDAMMKKAKENVNKVRVSFLESILLQKMIFKWTKKGDTIFSIFFHFIVPPCLLHFLPHVVQVKNSLINY